jgi:hypothetical protein
MPAAPCFFAVILARAPRLYRPIDNLGLAEDHEYSREQVARSVGAAPASAGDVHQ